MTFVLIGLRGSGNFLIRNYPTKNERNLALLALFPLLRGPRPARELLWKFRSLGLPPLLFPVLEVGRIRGGGGGLRVHLVLHPEGFPPLPLELGLARGGGGGGGVSLDVRPWRASAPLSLLPPLELERGRLLVRDGLPLPAALPRLLLPTHHSTLRDVVSWGKFRRTAPLLDPPACPVLRNKRHRRIVELALGRTALLTVAVVLALAPLPVRGQKVESVGGGHLLGLCPPASGRDLRIAPALGACALVLGETTFGVTGRGLLTATDRVVSVRVPPLVGRLAVTRSSTSPS